MNKLEFLKRQAFGLMNIRITQLFWQLPFLVILDDSIDIKLSRFYHVLNIISRFWALRKAKKYCSINEYEYACCNHWKILSLKPYYTEGCEVLQGLKELGYTVELMMMAYLGA